MTKPNNLQSIHVPDRPNVPGWVGGFEQSNPKFPYKNADSLPQIPDLSSLPLLDNMDNIDLLDRQQTVKWPEFSWEMVKGDAGSRCFQMFAPDISRIGYTNEGRIYSIICPQQGIYSELLGCMNVEVTVTGQRGWVNEDTKEMAADMMVVGKVWFSKGASDSDEVKKLIKIISKKKSEDVDFTKFPFSKENAIKINTYNPDKAGEKVFRVVKGETPKSRFVSPDFARHESEAWGVANIQVQIGELQSSGNEIVDEFNKIVMFIFNAWSGNMLEEGNTLTWNLWYEPPYYVDRQEWQSHAEKWRESLEANHGSPDGNGKLAYNFDGKEVKHNIGQVFKELLHSLRLDTPQLEIKTLRASQHSDFSQNSQPNVEENLTHKELEAEVISELLKRL